MFFFPYSTDAPVYHWPFATVGLIVANVLIFFGVMSGYTPGDDLGPWLLAYADGMHPEQWIGSRFMHAGFGHLFMNMVFLWVFGLVVEGKLGWWRFLAAYCAIGFGQAAIEQAAMLGYTGQVPGSLGASAAIYGLMAMAAVWAPANDVSFFYWIFFRIGSFEAPISGVAAFYIGLDLILALLLGGYAASSLLHIMGVVIGFPLGVLLLKRGVVDCEGWDLFTRTGWGKKKVNMPKGDTFEDNGQLSEKQRELLASASGQVAEYLKEGNAIAAAKLTAKMRDVGDGLRLEPQQLSQIVKGLHKQKRWGESAPFLAELIDRSPDTSDPLRVKLAQICVVELNRPGRAIDLLAAIDPHRLNDQQCLLAQQIAAKAEQMQDEGAVELDDGEW